MPLPEHTAYLGKSPGGPHGPSPLNSTSNPALTPCLCPTGAFVVCWTPGQVVLLLDGLDCKSCNVLAVEKYFLLLAEANSLVNAVVYSCRDAEMRRTFRRLLCCLCLRWSNHKSAHYSSSAQTGASTRIMLPENGHPLMDSTL